MEEAIFEDSIFSIVPKATPKECREILAVMAGPIEHLLGLKQCESLYEKVRSQSDSHLFMREVLRRMHVKPLVKPEDLESIPRKGPAVVVGNHPFGGIEGIIMAELLLTSARRTTA
jgi:putative hemolysin